MPKPKRSLEERVRKLRGKETPAGRARTYELLDRELPMYLHARWLRSNLSDANDMRFAKLADEWLAAKERARGR
jgi:hypothetical protein